ncbi:MAG: hypothetical protein A2Y40_10140 [Candidatus Margulisbacteria bacterium GWF2_35_9]|nr:MAG: hypothetical protein A2Y40_10140 [Candidatus Margulisbacteria bacterium GWF2_35_9]
MISILPLIESIVGVLTAIWGILVLNRGGVKKTNILFSLFCFSVSIWSLSYAMVYLSTDPISALYWVRMGFIGVVLMPAFIYDFISNYTKTQNVYNNIFIKFLYMVGVVYLVISRFDLFLQQPIMHWWGYYPVAGPTYLFFVFIFLLSFSLCPFLLFPTKSKKARFSYAKYKQIQILFIAYFLLVFSIVDYLPNFGVEIYPFAYILVFLWITLVAYTIIRHQFMDIDLVIKRGSYFILLFILFILPYIVLINYISSKFLFEAGIYNLLVSAVLWTTFFLFAERIKTFLGNVTDKIFFKADYNANEVMTYISNKLQVITDLKLLLTTLNDDLTEMLKVKNVGMFMVNKTGGSYVYLTVENMDVLINKQFDKQHVKEMTHLKKDHCVIKYLAKSENHIIMYDDIKERFSQRNDQEIINILMFMDSINSKLLVASVYNEKVSGIISVGEKKSGDAFRDKDVNLLSNVVQQGTLVISKIIEIDEKATIRAEKELHEAHHKEVEEKNQQLKDAMWKLSLTQEKLIEEEQMSAMGKLAGEVAHDMRNPLSSMNRLLHYLLDEGYIGDSEKVLVDVYKKLQGEENLSDKDQVLKYLKFLLSNNLEIKETLLEIVNINTILRKIANDFLEYSKVSQDIPTEKISIKECVIEKIKEYSADCEKTRVTINQQMNSDKKVILFDHQIIKIFGNLLDNAIKAVQEKEIAGNRDVTVSLDNVLQDGKEFVVLEVADSGIGMSLDHLSNIFKPFYTKRKNLQGTGLGLSIVKKIVERAGGIVTVKSKEGQGTTFKIILPCYD